MAMEKVEEQEKGSVLLCSKQAYAVHLVNGIQRKWPCARLCWFQWFQLLTVSLNSPLILELISLDTQPVHLDTAQFLQVRPLEGFSASSVDAGFRSAIANCTVMLKFLVCEYIYIIWKWNRKYAKNWWFFQQFWNLFSNSCIKAARLRVFFCSQDRVQAMIKMHSVICHSLS